MNRRTFLRRTALAGTVGLGLAGWGPSHALAEPPPETRKLKLRESPVTCTAPEYVAKELLHSEGFTELQYIKWDPALGTAAQVASGEVDLSVSFVPTNILHIDAGDPLVILAGSHIGCVELVASSGVKSTRELKGKTVAPGGVDGNVFISMFVAHVGLDPHKDINWKDINWVTTSSGVERARLLTEGKIDAFFTGPPFSQELREKKIGHVLVNTTTDKPWSQYFCCLVRSNKEFVRKHPVATKRALRAIVKAADVCALEPNRVARVIADKGLSGYEYALQMLREIPYGKWRQYDPEDTVRFFALRMHDVGIIKSSPQTIIAQGTDWRFLNELKRELKG